MRPALLNPLFAETTSLPGIGARLAVPLEGLCGPQLVDLCWHLPSGIIDRTNQPAIPDAIDGQIATFEIEVQKHTPARRRGQPWRVLCGNESGYITLVFFNAKGDWINRQLPVGGKRYISGRVEWFREQLQMIHPDHILTADEFAQLPLTEPVYPLTAGLTARPLARAMQATLAQLPVLPEWQDSAWLEKQNWPSWQAALRTAHHPQNTGDLQPDTPARQRLAYDELLANWLALGLVRQKRWNRPGRKQPGTGELTQKLLAHLPFSLTESQNMAIREITTDMAGEKRMLRLLQGDVGSGKTLVAFFAMLTAIESGAQAAIMAPTGILARQHADTLAPLCAELGVSMGLLTGDDKGKKREAILYGFQQGTTQLIIGTHALFQSDVAFHNLGLIVVDEQHRFGVHQRLTLSDKGDNTDILVMTATPIPRTLTLVTYGDMDVTRITEKPPGRQPVKTHSASLERIDEVMARLKNVIAEGQRVYWVCPLVEESDLLNLTAVEKRAAALKHLYGEKVGLIHGKMKAADKDRIMKQFQDGTLAILVSTTVIEVGVDIPQASVMIIEHAEHFGLSQLHQLRGRIGRGAAASSCLLLYQPPLGEAARARLNIMRETENGFLIAEEDLRLRGTGELLGTRQSGMPHFKLADLTVHDKFLTVIHDDVRLILQQDLQLQSPRGQALRLLLYLFRRDEAIRYLDSG